MNTGRMVQDQHSSWTAVWQVPHMIILHTAWWLCSRICLNWTAASFSDLNTYLKFIFNRVHKITWKSMIITIWNLGRIWKVAYFLSVQYLTIYQAEIIKTCSIEASALQDEWKSVLSEKLQSSINRNLLYWSIYKAGLIESWFNEARTAHG